MAGKLLEERFGGIIELGVKLERVGGLTVWEACPGYKHQAEVYRIQRSICPSDRTDCRCIQVADLSLVFPDGSEKRPDISIFCRVPDEEDSAVTLIPEAVIEVISKGYEVKDFEVGVPFYLEQGVKDVLTLDPRSKEVRHYRREGTNYFTSPTDFVLECGCLCTV